MSSFENIKDLGNYNISTSNVGKVLKLTTDSSFLSLPKVVIIDDDNNVVKRFSVDDGIELNEAGNEIKIVFNGVDFVGYIGMTLTGYCSVFVSGDRELSFGLKINKSLLW